jgi:FMN phosphatase YigB (HAD superfamily)
MRYLLWAPGLLARREGGVAGALADALDAAAVGTAADAAELRPYLDLPWDHPDRPHADWSGERWWTEHRGAFAAALSAVGLDRRRADAVAGDGRDHYADPGRWRVTAGAREVVKRLAERGWKPVLVANGPPDIVGVFAALGFGFEAAFVSAETGFEKPHVRAFETVVEWAETGAGSARLWTVGEDYERDVAPARRAGVPGILVGHHPEADRCCSDVHEVSGLLPE